MNPPGDQYIYGYNQGHQHRTGNVGVGKLLGLEAGEE